MPVLAHSRGRPFFWPSLASSWNQISIRLSLGRWPMWAASVRGGQLAALAKKGGDEVYAGLKAKGSVVEAAERAMAEGHNQYARPFGVPALVEAIHRFGAGWAHDDLVAGTDAEGVQGEERTGGPRRDAHRVGRAAALGGNIEIESQPGTGTLIRMEAPF